MSNKVLIFSDIHIHAHKRSINRIDDCLEVLKWVLNVAKEKNIKDVLFLGDLFHDRQKIDVLVYQKTFEIFLEAQLSDNPLSIYLLIGNHDMYHRDRWDINSVSPLNAIPGVKVIDSPETIEISGKSFDFLPHTEDPIEMLHSYKGKRDYLCAHLAVDGAMLNSSGTESDVIVEHDGEMIKVDEKQFGTWDYVFLGHYHAEQKIGKNIEYIGSPLQLNFGESFQTKHICILDPQTGEKEYVVNNFSPRHLVISEKEIEKYDLNKNFVRIVVEDITSSDVIEMHQQLRSESGASSLELKPIAKKLQEHVITDAKAILYKEEEMLEKYLEDVGAGDLDKEKLLNIGKKICEESGEEE